MRLPVTVMLISLIGTGFVVSYLIFRQMETKTVVFAEEVELERAPKGAMCGDVKLVVGGRTLGQWSLLIEEGDVLSGVVAVEGIGALDVLLNITSPNNDLIYWGRSPEHRQTFEVKDTIRGEYLFEFDNRHSALTSKTVIVSVCVS